MQEFENYLLTSFMQEKKQDCLKSLQKELHLELKNILSKYEMQNRLIKENKQGVSEENQKLLLELQKQNILLKEAQDEISIHCKT